MTGSNASTAQYASVTPGPPVGPPHPLPMTGQNTGMMAGAGLMLVCAGLVVAAIVKRWP